MEKPSNPSVQVATRFPSDLYEAMTKAAEHDHRKLADWIRLAVIEKLEREKRR